MIKNRKMTVKLYMDGEGDEATAITYDESFNIKVGCKKNALSIQNQCNIEITNMNEHDRNTLLGQMTAFRRRTNRLPFVPVVVRIGRDGDSGDLPIIVFRGVVVMAEQTLPPDIGVTLTCTTSQISKAELAVRQFAASSLKDACEKIAAIMGLELNYMVKTPLDARSWQYNQTVESLIALPMLMHSDRILSWVDDYVMNVMEVGADSGLPSIPVNSESGMIGIPTFTEWGVRFTVLADVPIKVGSPVSLKSIHNPAVNGEYIAVVASYQMETRGNGWYTTWDAMPPGWALV